MRGSPPGPEFLLAFDAAKQQPAAYKMQCILRLAKIIDVPVRSYS